METPCITDPARPGWKSLPPASRQCWLAWLAFLVPVILFWNTIGADFVRWDDDINIYRNPHLQGLTGPALKWSWTDHAYVRRYMPLGWTGWQMHYALDELRPASYHLGNLLLHGANSLLFFLILRRLLRRGEQRTGSGEPNLMVDGVALLAALFWSAHPLRVEPVAWASGRLYCQSVFLLLLSARCYLGWVDSIAGCSVARRRGCYAGAVVFFAASLLTYPVGVMWLGVLVLADFIPLRRLSTANWWHREARLVWLEKIPFVLVVGAMAGVTLWSRWEAKGAWDPPPSLAVFGLMERAMQAVYVAACFLWKSLYTGGLSPLYGVLLDFKPADGVFLASLALMILLGVGVLRVRRVAPWAGGLLLAYLILILPVLGWTEHPHSPADRYSYLPGLALAGLLACGLWSGLRAGWSRRTVTFAGVMVIAVMGWSTVRQAAVWRNSETLFLHMIAVLGDHPSRFDIYHRLGQHYLEASALPRAEWAFEQELALVPDVPRGLFSLGNTLAMKGEMAEALACYERCSMVASNYPNLNRNMGLTRVELGHEAGAIADLTRSVAWDGADAEICQLIAELHLRLGHEVQGREWLEKVLELDPQNQEAAAAMGRLHDHDAEHEEGAHE